MPNSWRGAWPDVRHCAMVSVRDFLPFLCVQASEHMNTEECDQRGGTYHRPSLLLPLNCSAGSCRVWVAGWEEVTLENIKGERENS